MRTLILLAALVAVADSPVEISPIDLAKRTDLVGREIVIDGRVAFFQSHEGIFDELFLKKTPIAFRLPTQLQATRNPEGPTARVQGILKKENGGLVVDVISLRMLPADLDRLKQGLALLSANDAEGRTGWARWARFRAAEYADNSLLDRARELDAEAIRIESARASAETSIGAIRLAKKARDLGVSEPEPSALAHRAFRLKLAESRTVTELNTLVAEIESFLPGSRNPVAAVDLSAWVESYRKDPAGSYRLMPESARIALDHALWADVVVASLDRAVVEAPDAAFSVAEAARARVPDRPKVAERIETMALDRATDADHLATMRKDELESLSRRFEAKGEPDEARSLKRRWLESQRRLRLRPGDAEGRVLLAAQFESTLGDRASAIVLLREAWAIDPQSKETAAAFRRLGYRKVGDDWQPSTEPVSKPAARNRQPNRSQAAEAVDGLPGDALRNLTRQEVRARLGEPGRIVRSATQAGVIEQWVYPGTRRSQYVNFFYKLGMPQPLVQRSYSIATP